MKKLKAAGITPMAVGEGDKWPGMHMWAYLVTRLGGKANFEAALYRTGSFTDQPFVEAGKKLQELLALRAFPGRFPGATYDEMQAPWATARPPWKCRASGPRPSRKEKSADKKGIGDNWACSASRGRGRRRRSDGCYRRRQWFRHRQERLAGSR